MGIDRLARRSHELPRPPAGFCSRNTAGRVDIAAHCILPSMQFATCRNVPPQVAVVNQAGDDPIPAFVGTLPADLREQMTKQPRHWLHTRCGLTPASKSCRIKGIMRQFPRWPQARHCPGVALTGIAARCLTPLPLVRLPYFPLFWQISSCWFPAL